MIPLDYTHLIKDAINELSDKQSCKELFHQHKDGEPIPSAKVLHNIKPPELRRILTTDVEAAYNGDPATTSFGEMIACYPVIRAISNSYRA